MQKSRLAILVSFACLIAGCATAQHKQQLAKSNPASSTAATKPAIDPNDPAYLTLDQIQPRPTLQHAKPATQPAPLDALDLYARARGAMLDGQRYTAINQLERAIKLDPESFELRYALGKAYLGNSAANDSSIEWFEKAAQINPDNLELQTLLGRQYLARNNIPLAIEHLRLAHQTTEYKQDDDDAAVADYFLAQALQQKGYDRAALECYDLLLRRLQSPTFSIRANPELTYLVTRPELLYVRIGELYERHGEYAEALHAYELAAGRDEGNFDLQARCVRVLIAMGNADEATRRAALVVDRFRASSDSLNLLREVYQKIGREGAVVEELRRLHRAKPDDHGVLFSLADMLRQQGRERDAEELLRESAKRNPSDIEVLNRLLSIYAQRDDTAGSARLIVESIAADPRLLRELSDSWAVLLRPTTKNHLRIPDLQKLEVEPRAEAAKQFLVSRLADAWNREPLARASLEKAVKSSPPFAPAYRVLVSEIWLRPELDDAQKSAACQELIDRVAKEHFPVLAGELRGLVYLKENRPDMAATELAAAVKIDTDKSPDLMLEYALALRLSNNQDNNRKFEQVLWKLVSDRPTYEDAEVALFRYYIDQGQGSQAVKVLNTWLSADPTSVNARLLQATLFIQAKRPDAGEALLNKLFEEDGDNVEVLVTMREFYHATSRLDEFIAKLEDQRAKHPESRNAVEMLIDIYASQRRMPDATRVLDAMHKAVADDPDLLYYVAHLYTRVDQKDMTEQVLGEVLKLDPVHAPASNDLGYGWADRGVNLDRAEVLVRQAVEQEPDNQSFLDSLGWVLYKRGRFDEARAFLAQAIGTSAHPDPVVLDHMGDALYRLGRTDEAGREWRRSLDRLDDVGAATRDDLKQLKLQLLQKIKQGEEHKPINVAPVVEQAPRPAQAKG